MTKVSVCIPAFHNVESVKRLLASIEKQTFRDYEVIITDDSGDDAVKKLAEEKEYVTYYKNEMRLGAAANWNEAVRRSSGEYVKLMHHDDWFTEENSLAEFVRMLEEHPEADLAFSGTRQVQDGEDAGYDRAISEKDAGLLKKDYRNLFLGNTIGAPSAVIVRRSAIAGRNGQKGIEYEEALTWLVDLEYDMQILAQNPCFVYTEKPLVTIGMGENQLTEKCRDNRELNVFEYSFIFRKYKLETERPYLNKLISVCADAGKSAEEAVSLGLGIDKKEYKKALGRKWFSKLEWKCKSLLGKKWFLCLLIALFAASLIPLLMLSPVNCATGDDLGYGKLTHEAWTATHSLIEVVKAAGETVRGYYRGWQGTWLSIFLFSFQPEVFSPSAYVIVPVLMLAVWLLATGVTAYELLVKKAGYGKNFFCMVYLLFATAAIQFVPSTKSAVFWYNGTAHYIIPYAIALFGICFYIKFMENKKGNGAAYGLSYAGLLICMALLGGVNYQAALLTPVVTVLLSCCYWQNRDKRKRIGLYLLPLALEAVGLVISMKSPGNAIRGGENFGFSPGLAVKTILSCFVRGITQAWEYITKHPLLVLIFVAAALVVREALKGEKAKKSYPHPVLFTVLSYCVYCAMFAPELYAGVEVSGGVWNMNFYLFLFMIFGDIIYIAGAWESRLEEQTETAVLPVLALLLLLTLLCRWDVAQTTTVRCIDYMRSGQAADFKRQMKLQKETLLDENIQEVVLPQINDNQGPLMHMPLTENPDGWTNQVTREFYGKKSVTAIPWEQWEKLQN